MQCYEVIIHLCKGVYITVDITVAVTTAIQLVFVGQIHGKYHKERVVDEVDEETMIVFISEHVEEGATVYTDGSLVYDNLWEEEFNHDTVIHSRGEYVRGDGHTNGIEGFWVMIKRGYMGVYHLWSRRHLPRYIGEFVARHNLRAKDTIDQMKYIVQCFEGQRLQYCDLIA